MAAEPSSQWSTLDARNPMAKARRRLDYNAAVVLMLFALWQWLASSTRATWLLGLMFALLLATWWLGVLIHELGHAAAARVVGLDPYVVIVGSGRSILRFRMRGLTLDLGWLPATGLTMFGSSVMSAHRSRVVAALAGGPVASLLVLSGALCFGLEQLGDGMDLGQVSLGMLLTGSSAEGSSLAGLAIAALLISNAAVLLTSLLPKRSRLGTAAFESDLVSIGRLLLGRRVSHGPSDDWATQREFARLLALREYDAAERYANQTLKTLPALWELRFEFASMLLTSERCDEAAHHLEQIVQGPPPREPHSRERLARTVAVLADRLARRGESSARERAEYWRAQALAPFPTSRAVLNCRDAAAARRR